MGLSKWRPYLPQSDLIQLSPVHKRMQDIGQHFRVYNIFGDYFNVLLPIDCAIQQDDTSPYYFATVQMDVTCPSMSSENNPEIEELI